LENSVQNKNIAWYLPRPKIDKYRGGMPLHCEKWLLSLAKELLQNDKPKILNLFCGMNKEGVRIDLNPNVFPDYLIDAHEISKFITELFDVILADPPYSNKEAKHLYPDINLPKLNYKKWTNECDKLLKKNGLLIVYNKMIMPNPNPNKFRLIKRVFIGHRIYHVPRVALFFKKIVDG